MAGEWYEWFLARHSRREGDWEQTLDQVQSAMREAIGEKQWEENDPNELWEQDEKLRKAVRPVLADVGETAQFLAAKAVVLNNEARDLFLDFLYKDLAAALKRLIRMSEGDYSPDEYRKRFPKLEGKRAATPPYNCSTAGVLNRSQQRGPSRVGNTSSGRWRDISGSRCGLDCAGRSAEVGEEPSHTRTRARERSTTRGSLRAEAVFGWAAEHNHVPLNPFEKAKVTIPRRTRLRETQAFRPDEQRTILKAALEIGDTTNRTTQPEDGSRGFVRTRVPGSVR